MNTSDGDPPVNDTAKPLAIVPRRSAGNVAQWQPTTYAEMERVAIALARSGFFRDTRDAAQALTLMLAGREYGLGPIAALNGFYFVESRLTLGASTIGGIIKRSNIYDYRVRRRENDGCKIEWFENGESVGFSEFKAEDAARAGLTTKTNYKNYPRAMMFARALTEGARSYCPDVFGGAVYTPDELDANIAIGQTGDPLARPQESWPEQGGGQGALPPAPADPAASPPRKALAMPALIDLFRQSGVAGKLGAWLVEEIAPDLPERRDPITGVLQNSALTEVELFAAEDKLRALIAAKAPVQPVATVEPPATNPETGCPACNVVGGHTAGCPEVEPSELTDAEQAQLAFGNETGLATGITALQRKRIQSMFTKRKGALEAMYPALITIDARRHQFAADVLGDNLKRSSTSWSQSDYKRVSDRLELVQPD
jgi:hypothetical protein